MINCRDARPLPLWGGLSFFFVFSVLYCSWLNKFGGLAMGGIAHAVMGGGAFALVLYMVLEQMRPALDILMRWYAPREYAVVILILGLTLSMVWGARFLTSLYSTLGVLFVFIAVLVVPVDFDHGSTTLLFGMVCLTAALFRSGFRIGG